MRSLFNLFAVSAVCAMLIACGQGGKNSSPSEARQVDGATPAVRVKVAEAEGIYNRDLRDMPELSKDSDAKTIDRYYTKLNRFINLCKEIKHAEDSLPDTTPGKITKKPFFLTTCRGAVQELMSVSMIKMLQQLEQAKKGIS